MKLDKNKIKIIFKSKAFWLLAIFWVFVGAASSGFYNMQTLITQVWFQDPNVFEAGSSAASSANTLGASIIGGAGIVAAFVGSPIVGLLIDKFKSYKKTIATLLAVYIICNIGIFGIITPTYIGSNSSLLLGLLIGLVTPILGICYGFRNPIDAYNTLYAEENKIPLGFVAGIYAIGFGITGYGLNYLIQWYSNSVGSHNQSPNYIYFYLIYSGILAVLLIYMLVFMPEPKRNLSTKNLAKSNNDMPEKEEKKALLKNKNLWFGTIAFMIIIGFYIAIDIFYINILPKKGILDLGNTNHFKRSAQVGWSDNIIQDVKGLFDLIRGPIMALSFMFASIIIIKFGLKKSMILAALSGLIAALSIGFSIINGYYKWVLILVPSFTIPILAALGVSASYKFMQLLTTRRIRATIMTMFNGVAYGLGGLIFGLLGPVLFDRLGGLQKWNVTKYTLINGQGAIKEIVNQKPQGQIGIDYVQGHYQNGQGWITFIVMGAVILLSFVFIFLMNKDIKTKAVKQNFKKNKNNFNL